MTRILSIGDPHQAAPDPHRHGGGYPGAAPDLVPATAAAMGTHVPRLGRQQPPQRQRSQPSQNRQRRAAPATAQAVVSGPGTGNGRAQLLTRTGLDWTDKYPSAAAALANLNVKTAYLDGELCGVDDAGQTTAQGAS